MTVNYIGYVFTAICVALAVLIQSHIYINDDVGVHIYYARMMFSGKELYKDIYEINPPLIIWMTYIPVYISKMLGISDVIATTAFNFLLLLAGMCLSFNVLRNTVFYDDKIEYTIIVCAIAFGIFIYPFASRIFQDFGQKEYIFISLALPYIFSHFVPNRNLISRKKYAVIGFLAGMGCCLKPFFFIIPIALEIRQMIVNKSCKQLFRTETITALIVTLCYSASIAIFSAEYITQTLPLAKVTNPFFKEISQSLLNFLAGIIGTKNILLLAIPIISTYYFFRKESKFSILFLCFMAALLIPLPQGKGWDYHYIPSAVIGIILLSLMAYKTIMDCLPKGKKWGGPFFIITFSSIAFLVTSITMVVQMYEEKGFNAYYQPAIAKDSINATKSQNIYYFSNVFTPFINLDLYGDDISLDTEMPYQNLLFSTHKHINETGEIDPAKAADVNKAIQYYEGKILADFNRTMPDIVFVERVKISQKNMKKCLKDKGKYESCESLSHLGIMLKNNHFSKKWENYHYIKTIKRIDPIGVWDAKHADKIYFDVYLHNSKLDKRKK